MFLERSDEHSRSKEQHAYRPRDSKADNQSTHSVTSFFHLILQIHCDLLNFFYVSASYSIICMFHNLFNSHLLIDLQVIAILLLLLQAKSNKHEIVSTICWNPESELETQLFLFLFLPRSLFLLYFSDCFRHQE